MRRPTAAASTQTPFESNLYDNPYEDDDSEVSSLAEPPDTKLVIGINKYTHDTSICAADAASGQPLYAMSKERLTRRKHDSGNVASLVEHCLEALDLHIDNIQKVVMNNHHHRLIPLEANVQRLEWEAGLDINGGREEGYDAPENLLPGAERYELSHHLAHAYSTATQAPFDSGLVVVMDGMGETFRTMQRGVEMGSVVYTSDLSFGIGSFQCIPGNIVEQAALSYFDWREAESVYLYEKSENTIDLFPIFKRFTPENSPPSLYNHGFENMDSVGAVYSRASMHIFGDWNCCGKVMGLAPWAYYRWIDDDGKPLVPPLSDTPIMSGSLYTEGGFTIDRRSMEGLPLIARADPDLFEPDGTQKRRYNFDDTDHTNADTVGDDSTGKRLPSGVALEAIALAHRVQTDLETVVMDFVRYWKDETGSANLCLAGGVALNSVLNGRLARELGFEQTFVSPYPGDDGIAVGCCAFGVFGSPRLDGARRQQYEYRPPMWRGPMSPFAGSDPSDLDMRRAIDAALPWLDVEAIRDEDQRLFMMAQMVEAGAVIAWYRGRPEIGPRALGHRSILADPRKRGLVRFINEYVKNRECFRPFAPSVLAEEAINWFDLGYAPFNGNVSPFMSLTAMVQEDKRARYVL